MGRAPASRMGCEDWWSLGIQVLDAELRPSFKAIHLGADGIDLLKARELQVLFGARYFAGRELHDVHDAEVNASHLGAVIVDQTDNTLMPAAFNFDLFVQLSLHSGGVPVVAGGVFNRNVATDSDRSFRVEPLFPLPFPACVLEELGLIRVAAFQDDVRDQLFERRVILDDAAWSKRLVGAIQDRRQVSIDIVLEAGKRAQLIEEPCWHYEYFFVFGHSNSGEIRREVSSRSVDPRSINQKAGLPSPRGLRYDTRFESR